MLRLALHRATSGSRALSRSLNPPKLIAAARLYGTEPPQSTIVADQMIRYAFGLARSKRSGQFSVARRYHLGGLYGLHSYPVVPIQKSRSFCTTGTDKVNVEGIEQNEKITVTFVDKDGEETVIKVPVGMSMLEAAHENDIELEGACEGSLACSTCHVIVMEIPYYNKLEDPTDEENDMLDLAFGLTETSRLGCQVIAKPELDGIRLALPAATRNFAVDGHVPKPH